MVNVYNPLVLVFAFAGRCVGSSCGVFDESPVVYTRNASVLVKEDAKNSSSMSGGVSSELSNIGILRTNTNINNEIITMQSPVIMTEVVKRLGLNNVYSVRRGLRTVNLYQDSPIAVTFNQNATHAVSFVVNLVSDSQFEITHCKLDGKKLKEGSKVILMLPYTRHVAM